MNTARRLIGLLLIIFLGLPTLFGIIWAVGMIQASVSAEFLTDLPREIIADIPDKADEIFREAQDERVIIDDNTRAWFQAAAKTGISPRDLMEKTGLLEWLTVSCPIRCARSGACSGESGDPGRLPSTCVRSRKPCSIRKWTVSSRKR